MIAMGRIVGCEDQKGGKEHSQRKCLCTGLEVAWKERPVK